MENVIKQQDAEDALDLVSSSQAGVADRLVTPWWYHPALGVLIGMLVAAPAARSYVVLLSALGVFGLGTGLLVAVYRRMTGLWISGFNAGRASRWAIALGAAAGGSYVAGYLAAQLFGWWQVSVVLAVLVVPETIIVGRRFDDALRAQLRAGE